MRRFWGWTLGLLALLLAAMAATVPTRLDVDLWHYNAAFLVALAAAGAAWPLLRRRRFATLSMAGAGAVATLSGFAMLYTTDFPYKEWVTWWHSVASLAFGLAFLVHWLHNNPRLLSLVRRLLARERTWGLAAAAAWLAVAAALAWTWTPSASARFTRGNYLYLASLAVFVGVTLTYGTWLAYRLPAMRARLARTPHRNRARGLVDASLFLSNWGALLTGFALLYLADVLRAGDLKYVSKWWHTATSVALLAFATLHVGFNARILRAHARRVDGGSGRE